MKYNGTVKGGVVVIEGGATLREGAHVRVEILETSTTPSTLGQRLRRFSGAAKQLPNDMAAQHDHYLHGRPKK